jgi:MFS family permease
VTVSLAPRAAAPEAVDEHHTRRWWILGVLALAQLMVVLDSTVVNIALPHAQSDLHFSNGDRQWIVTAYSLAFGSLLLLGGRLSDMFGRKRVFIAGVIGFAAASAVGGAAGSFGMLVVARAVQGAFGALLAPAALSLLTTTFVHPEERGKAFGIYGGIAAAGASVGLLLGGVLTEYLDWRWTMYVNVLIAVVAVAGGLVLLAPHAAEVRQRIDRAGTVLACAGMFAIVYGFAHAATKSGSAGWTDPQTLGFLLGGLALLVAFVFVERRAEHPLLPLRVVTDRNRGGAYMAMFLASVGMFGVFLFLTYYLETILGYSPVTTGLAFLPLTGAVMVSSGLANTADEARQPPRARPGRVADRRRRDGAAGADRDALELRVDDPAVAARRDQARLRVRALVQPRDARCGGERRGCRLGDDQCVPADRRLDRDRTAQQHCDECRGDVHDDSRDGSAVGRAGRAGVGPQLHGRVLGWRRDLRRRRPRHLPGAAARRA